LGKLEISIRLKKLRRIGLRNFRIFFGKRSEKTVICLISHVLSREYRLSMEIFLSSHTNVHREIIFS
jgi:hypothetical protein